MKKPTESEFLTNLTKGRVVQSIVVLRPIPECVSMEIFFADGTSLYTQSTMSYDVKDTDLDVEIGFSEDGDGGG